jgi:hypothetical protein
MTPAFREIVGVDFEFSQDANGRPVPVCLVAHEFRRNLTHRLWLCGEQFDSPPFPTGRDTVFTAYFASAELGCFRVLNWAFPCNVIDLYAEFRCKTNGLSLPHGRGLVGSLQYYGLPAMQAAEKDTLRKRIVAGPPFTADEQQTIIRYCELDVQALVKLWPRLISDHGNLLLALLRGEFMKCIAAAEHAGIPMDRRLYNEMLDRWAELQGEVISRVNAVAPVFEDLHFRSAKFESWLREQKIYDWPRTVTGELSLHDDTFRDLAARYPQVEPLRQVRQLLGQLHKPGLTIGVDGRNRCLLSPYGTKTGRNCPSTAKFIFAAPSFLRGLVKPEPGRAIAYLDWSSQEFAVGAALSNDASMMAAYQSGDVYLAFARFAHAVPEDATEESHPKERALFKTVILGVQYLIGADGLAYRLGILRQEAQDLLDHHRKIFHRFWAWSDAVADYGQLRGELVSTFGWRIDLSATESIRTIRNWPMQSNASEMLRIACILALRSEVSVIAMIHDAILIEANEPEIEHKVALARKAMEQASELVLAGFRLRTGKPQIIRPPHRFVEKRSLRMWDWMLQSLQSVREQPSHLR